MFGLLEVKRLIDRVLFVYASVEIEKALIQKLGAFKSSDPRNLKGLDSTEEASIRAEKIIDNCTNLFG